MGLLSNVYVGQWIAFFCLTFFLFKFASFLLNSSLLFVLLPFPPSFLITHPPLFTIFLHPPSFFLGNTYQIYDRAYLFVYYLTSMILTLPIFLRNGYKMCIRAYLNGDGSGYKTHFSVFFVLMRGEFDPLLKWPFEYKVTNYLFLTSCHSFLCHVLCREFSKCKISPNSQNFCFLKSEIFILSSEDC